MIPVAIVALVSLVVAAPVAVASYVSMQRTERRHLDRERRWL